MRRRLHALPPRPDVRTSSAGLPLELLRRHTPCPAQALPRDVCGIVRSVRESDWLPVRLSVRILHNSIALDHRQRIGLAVDQPMRRPSLEPSRCELTVHGNLQLRAVPQVVRLRPATEPLACYSLSRQRTLSSRRWSLSASSFKVSYSAHCSKEMTTPSGRGWSPKKTGSVLPERKKFEDPAEALADGRGVDDPDSVAVREVVEGFHDCSDAGRSDTFRDPG
jgi:hypothetical protein